ncbi:MAG: hypothetical protein IKK57_05340 [Clostridia bacterium]|nr:hypothetical protein [Clostridia bacterium]
MPETREILDRQLRGVCFTPQERRAVLHAIRKERPVMKKKLIPVLLCFLLLFLLTGAALAAGVLWGVEDFAARSGIPLPDAPVQQPVSQSGGVGEELTVAVTDAVWDGETVCITLHCQPHAEDLLLMDACLQLDMPASNLDRALPRGLTIADWVSANSFTDVLGVAVEPMLNDRYLGYRVSWHLEENGGCTLFYEFDGVADGPLALTFQCVTWGWDEARGGFCSDGRNEVFDLTCTLKSPMDR